MELFSRLLFGHFLADFTFQTNFIADWKRRRMMGLLVHVIIHPITYVILLWDFHAATWICFAGFRLNLWSCLAIVTVLHFLEDWFRVIMVNRGWRDNILFYGWDQFVHLFVLIMVSPIQTQPLYSSWPIVGTLFVVVTHFATVTVWFIEKGFKSVDYPETEEKYISMLQRLVLWLAFFLPSPWWIIITLFVLFMFGRHVWTRRIDFSLTSIVLGQSIAIAAGALGRFYFHLHF